MAKRGSFQQKCNLSIEILKETKIWACKMYMLCMKGTYEIRHKPLVTQLGFLSVHERPTCYIFYTFLSTTLVSYAFFRYLSVKKEHRFENREL
jgi:hypothetical protein